MKTASEFNKVDVAATRQKKVDFYTSYLMTCKIHLPDKRQEIDDIVKNIFIDDDLFSDTDTKDICNLVDQKKSETDVNDVLLEHDPADTTSNILPSPELLLSFSDILLKTNNGKNETAKKIRQKYKNIRQNKDKIKKVTKQAIKEMKKSNYLETDDAETVNYNDGINIDDISTAGNVEIENMSDAETIDYDKVNKGITQQNAKRIINQYRNLKSKAAMNNKNKTKKRKDDDVIFVKQVPVHPRDRLACTTKNKDDDVIFVKQVPVHWQDRLARTTKNKDDDVIFVKQVPIHPRNRLQKRTKKLTLPHNRMKNKELQMARDNVSALRQGKFSFSPKNFLNRTNIFDVSKVHEEQIMDKIIENLPTDNDGFYIVHEPSTNSFSLDVKMENKPKTL